MEKCVTRLLTEHFYKTLLDSIFDAVYVVDNLGRVMYWNDCCARITGYMPEEMVGKHYTETPFVGMEKAENVNCSQHGGIAIALDAGMPGTWKGNVQRKNGQLLPIESHVSEIRDEKGNIVGAVEVFRDISAYVSLEQAHRELLQLSRKDQLTSMNNRAAITDFLKAEIERAHRYRTPLSVVMVDIDHFKRINDRYGHEAGDKVLAKIGSILQYNIRKPDMVGRWGGEEFLIITPNSTATNAGKLAERIRLLIKEIPDGDLPETITASFGVAEFSHEAGMDKMLYHADMAMYNAKEGGRDRVEIAGVHKAEKN